VTPPVALTIAGSDSGAGAGVQADLKTFAALGVFGTSAITALTAQNTAAVLGVLPVDATFVVAQAEAVLDDFTVRAVNTGLLATPGTVAAVADLADAGRLPNLVVDPVMVASTGDRLLDPDAEALYRDRLLAAAVVATPNAREAAVLVGAPLRTLDDRRDAAATLGGLGAEVVVITGGDTPAGDQSIDIVWGVDDLTELSAPRVDTRHTHGSGCSFAAAVAAGLARGQSTRDALVAAKSFVHDAIEQASCWQLGSGHGPLNHLQWEETP
jgi:hydroxymethylpyrimidine/phosphomethylpyrimidine kinase